MAVDAPRVRRAHGRIDTATNRESAGDLSRLAASVTCALSGAAAAPALTVDCDPLTSFLDPSSLQVDAIGRAGAPGRALVVFPMQRGFRAIARVTAAVASLRRDSDITVSRLVVERMPIDIARHAVDLAPG